MRVNCLGPRSALQYACMPTNYKCICLRNHAFGVCCLLYPCHRFLSWGEVSRCLRSYRNLLFVAGDSRVLAAHTIAGSLGDGVFLSPISIRSPMLKPAPLSSFALSHLLRIFPPNTFFQAEAPTRGADQKPRGYREPELLLAAGRLAAARCGTDKLTCTRVRREGKQVEPRQLRWKAENACASQASITEAVSRVCSSFHTQMPSLVLLF